MKGYIFIAFLIFSLNGFSQPDPEDGDAFVPIDGGIGLLLASGAALGGRILFQRRRGGKN